MSEVNWEKYNATKLTFGEGWGTRAICQNCGYRQKIRLQKGVKISHARCFSCGQLTLTKAKIDNQGNLLNDPSIERK